MHTITQGPFGNSLPHIAEAQVGHDQTAAGMVSDWRCGTERRRLPATRQVGDPRDDSLIMLPRRPRFRSHETRRIGICASLLPVLPACLCLGRHHDFVIRNRLNIDDRPVERVAPVAWYADAQRHPRGDTPVDHPIVHPERGFTWKGTGCPGIGTGLCADRAKPRTRRLYA